MTQPDREQGKQLGDYVDFEHVSPDAALNAHEERLAYPELSVHDVPSVPFFIFHSNDYGTKKLAEGLIRLEKDRLVLEMERNKQFWQHQSWQRIGGNFSWQNVWGLVNDISQGSSREIVTLEIPLTDIEMLEAKRGLFWGTEWFYRNAFFLKVKKLNMLADVPGAKMGTVRLVVPKAHRKHMLALLSRAMLIRSEIMLRNI
jgi:hypothetical protein